jgi:hypothetical protein
MSNLTIHLVRVIGLMDDDHQDKADPYVKVR